MKFVWEEITKTEFDAEVSENFFVEVIRGTELIKEQVKGADYNKNSWYGYLWTFSKEKGRMGRRRVCERDNAESCMEAVENYVNSGEIQELIKKREGYYAENQSARNYVNQIADRLGIPVRRKDKRRIVVEDYSQPSNTGGAGLPRILDLN